MKTIGFGTGRIGEAFDEIKNNGDTAISFFPHHMHYPSQVLQAIKHYNGAEETIPPGLLYLISEASLVNSATRPGYLKHHKNEVKEYAGFIDKHDRFVIEISELDELTYDEHFYTEYFATKDLRTYQSHLELLSSYGQIEIVRPFEVIERRIPDSYLISVMSEISRVLDEKPILWVSHFDASAPEEVRNARRRCIDVVKRGAKTSGGSFFDPTNVIFKLGQSAALKDDGRDLSHYSAMATSCVAEVLECWTKGQNHPWIV
jgi:hypothetical protein